MTPSALRRIRKPLSPVHHSAWIPSRSVEYAYYFTVAYSVTSAYLGIEVPLVAAVTTVALSGFCFRRLGSRAKEILAPIAFLFACAISFIIVQIAVHGTSPTEEIIRQFVLWICGMIIVQSLCLRRGFLLRYTFVFLMIGVIAVFNLSFSEGDVVARAAADISIAGNLTNANGLAGWFGFCMVSFAMLGLEAKRVTIRTFYWLAAAGCLFIVGITVSRSVLFASALAITAAFRDLLKRGFLPVFLLIIFTGFILESGWLAHIVSLYEERGMEETGRFLLWPYVVERILSSPIVGVGFSNISTYIPEMGGSISTPHNSFLFFALSSGVVPFAFWISFWIGAGRRSFSHIKRLEYDSFRMPFLIYGFVGSMFGDMSIAPWVLVVLSVGAGSGASHVRQHLIMARRLRGRRAAQSFRPPSRAANL